MLDWEKLYRMQLELDTFIEKEKDLEKESLFDKKVVALFVELGELANETRCFKFWSDKAPSERSIILEEYVDGVHFLLSLGLEKNLRYNLTAISAGEDLSLQFKQIYGAIHVFAQSPVQETYNALWNQYLSIGKNLGFNEQEIIEAYIEKNEVNVIRQKQGY
ncbi:dUTPase [Jeotgalibacillus sp. S-D1]|uniref:dUTP diphosphatase n=1 Tax=Jeotgalibacillus sp. S-D1 TaxID=2552189 RepID=UPI00105AA98D|nr:dUTP diphosphatase [Jeotgalibacillus sp. S-D1]TDL34354.1 dUTPase [Jeotgalibacillus sp. S-D1]